MRNLHMAWITDVLRSEWYVVIHDLLPTNDRLYRISLTDTDRCHTCGEDTTVHRILECGEERTMWHWTRVRLAMILRSKANLISSEWPLRPSFHVWPPPNGIVPSCGSWCTSSTSVSNTAPRLHSSTTRTSWAEHAGKCITCQNAKNELGTT
jgi:hypothetical protein